MNYRLVACVIMLAGALYTDTCTDDKLKIKDQTFLIYRRYYFIARLDKTIKLLAKFSRTSIKSASHPESHLLDDLSLVPEMQLLQHALVKDSITSMQQQRSLKPLFMVWDSFKAYKSLKDDLFVEDFSKENFIITRTIAQRFWPDKTIKSSIDTNIVCRCDAISRLTEYIEQHIEEQDASRYVTKKVGDVSDLALTIHTDEVAMRYYILHRLHDGASLLLHLPREKMHAIHQAVSGFKRSSKHKIVRQRTFAQLWDDCKQYKFVDDMNFIHAFAVELAIMLHAYQEQNAQEQRTVNYVQLMHIYQQINKMPLEEILNSIDFLVSHVMALSDDYHKSGLTLGQWVQQYWWAPPMIIATAISQCVKFYYKNFSQR